MTVLGVCYSNGWGVIQDSITAFNWNKKAAEWDGDLMIVEAQFAMGYNYATGEGVTQDYIRAYMWWDIATKNGDKRAVSNLNILKKGISLSEASSAKFLVRECVKKKYKDC